MSQKVIKRLSNSTINRIAAGEVVDRPASVIKELIENAIDAGADSLDIIVTNGGKGLISIRDNGCGMTKSDIALAIERHTTSKLDEHDITNIVSFGFRGEALPSICSISKVLIKSKPKIDDRHLSKPIYDEGVVAQDRNVLNVHEDLSNGATTQSPSEIELRKMSNIALNNEPTEIGTSFQIIGGDILDISACTCDFGTTIEVSDLFFSTPARLKFLKSDRVESAAIIDIVKRIAIAHPTIRISLTIDGKNIIKFKSEDLATRIASVIGNDFIDNSIAIQYINNVDPNRIIQITGLISLPTFNNSTAQAQYLYVNNRPVKDKLISTAIRVAYSDVIPRDRYAVAALFIDIPPFMVDVNVHPAKSEVRFRKQDEIQQILIGVIKNSLLQNSAKTNTQNSQELIKLAYSDRLLSTAIYDEKAERGSILNVDDDLSNGAIQQSPSTVELRQNSNATTNNSIRPQQLFEPQTSKLFTPQHTTASHTSPSKTEHKAHKPIYTFTKIDTKSETINNDINDTPLGEAVAQLHNMYIISQTNDAIIITDQHAAHERIIYERLKNITHDKPLLAQRLLIPVIVNFFDIHDTDIFFEYAEELSRLGFGIKKIGEKSVVINEAPAILGQVDVNKLIHDIIEELKDSNHHLTFDELISHIYKTFACHHSIRAGYKMLANEMNKLLRDMETTQLSGQCNHGRPTYIELKIKDIHKLFER